MRIPPVGRRRGAMKDGPVGMNGKPLDGCREALDEASLYVVGARGLAIGLFQHGLQVLIGKLLDMSACSFHNPGHLAAEDHLEAGKVHQALVVQFPPEGLRQELLDVGDPHVPEAQQARGFHFDGPSHGL